MLLSKSWMVSVFLDVIFNVLNKWLGKFKYDYKIEIRLKLITLLDKAFYNSSI